MERLGADELIFIFDKFNNSNDKASFSQVSKQFLKIACIHRTRLHISSSDLLKDILPASTNLKTCYCSKPLSDTHMKLIAYSCHNLSVLNLELEADSNPDDFLFDFTDDGLCAIASACNRLYEIHLSGRLHFGDVGILALVKSCKNLTILELGGCVGVTDESLKGIGESSCLQRLVLKGCKLITDLGLEYIGNGEVKDGLNFLNLSECDKISDKGIIYLKQMVNLEYLNLSRCGFRVTEIGIGQLFFKLSNIVELDLSWLISVTDTTLFVISNRCLKLNTIRLNGCETITGRGLRNFATHPTLELLELLSSHKFSRQDRKWFELYCPGFMYPSFT